jgi:hypothetical protein
MGTDSAQHLIEKAYTAFNKRDIDGVLALMGGVDIILKE